MWGSRKHPYHPHYDVQFYQTQICKFGGTNFDTPTVSSWDEVLISFFILLQVFLCSRKFMKLPKFDILVNKTTYLFITIREPYFQWVCKNFGNSGGEGKSHTANPFRGAGMDIFWNHKIECNFKTLTTELSNDD